MSSRARTSAGSVTGLPSRPDSRNRAASSTSRSGLGPERVSAGAGPAGTRSAGPAGQSSGSCTSTALLPLSRVTEVAALLGYVHEARPPGRAAPWNYGQGRDWRQHGRPPGGGDGPALAVRRLGAPAGRGVPALAPRLVPLCRVTAGGKYVIGQVKAGENGGSTGAGHR